MLGKDLIMQTLLGGGSSGGGSSGGGGGVQPDWNQNDPTAADYVKGRTHYAYTELVEEVPETSFTTVEDNGEYSAFVDVVASVADGDACAVVYDGTAYKCTAWVFGNVHALGNGGLLSGAGIADTGEPFCIISAAGIVLIVNDTEVATHTIAIFKEQETIHTIDPKFLPAGAGGYDAIIEWNNGSDRQSALPAYDALDRFSDGSGLYNILRPIMKAGKMPNILLHCIYADGEYHAYYTPIHVQLYNVEESSNVIYIYVLSNATAGFTMRRIDVKPSGITGCINMPIVPSAT